MAQEVDSFFQSFLNFRSRRKVHCSDAQIQHLSCLATPGFIPLGDPRFYPAWRAQHLSRLVNPVFIPLSGPRFYPAWRAQVLSRLVNPVFIPLGEPSVYPAWRAQVLSRLASPGFIPLGKLRFYPAWRPFRYAGFICYPPDDCCVIRPQAVLGALTGVAGRSADVPV